MIDLPVIDVETAKADDKKYKFWRSPADLKQDASMLHLARPEFLPGVDEAPGGASRRQFIQLMGGYVKQGFYEKLVTKICKPKIAQFFSLSHDIE